MADLKYQNEVASLYVAVCECTECQHVDINGDGDKAACNTCDWRGPSPNMDHCPGCGRDGTMTSACTECGARSTLLAEARLPIATPPAPALASPPVVEAAPGMAVQGLAGEIIEALIMDEKDGGYDLIAGMFGQRFSDLVRRWAALEYASLASPPVAVQEEGDASNLRVADIAIAKKVLARLCDEGHLSMSIPVRHDDEDMVLARVIDSAAGWQPIETAPKDGLVDILLPSGRRYAHCHYDKICGEYRHITACGVLIRLGQASHWMPVPALPAAIKGDQP